MANIMPMNYVRSRLVQCARSVPIQPALQWQHTGTCLNKLINWNLKWCLGCQTLDMDLTMSIILIHHCIHQTKILHMKMEDFQKLLTLLNHQSSPEVALKDEVGPSNCAIPEQDKLLEQQQHCWNFVGMGYFGVNKLEVFALQAFCMTGCDAVGVFVFLFFCVYVVAD